MSLLGHFPALPRRSIAVRSTSVNGHSARRGTAGLVGFMTIRVASAYPSRPFFTPTISLAKIIFPAVSFDYLRPSCEIPPASRRGIAPHQPADPWQGGSLIGDVVVENGKPADCLPLLDAEKESDMARPKQSEPSLGLDRRQLLAIGSGGHTAGTVPNAEAAAEARQFWPKQLNVGEIRDRMTPALNVCAGDRSEN